ncbi:FCHO1 protein, partial [Prunella himalayana]|nr:FCHO1 protein [Prunella himalayana]
PWQGEKNHGFDVLYHNMKHGQISTKELADFVRERAAIEENYAKAMVKLSKMATNGTQLGTFAPLWEVFRISSDKLALCHLELMKKLHELIKEISRYGEEQGRVHKKSKEEVSGTLEAVQLLHGVAQLLPKSKESYHSKCQEYERLRKEGTSQKEIDKAELKSRKAGEALRRAVDKYNAARADFEQRMLDSAMRFQEVEEAHLRHMKGLIGSYSHSVEDTHVQIGQVHEEFKQNVENIGTEMLLRRFAESKGTGRERPGEAGGPTWAGPLLTRCTSPGAKRSRSKAFRIPGLSRRERERGANSKQGFFGGSKGNSKQGFLGDPRRIPARCCLDGGSGEAENPGCSSSDSDYDEDEPRKFYVHIKPAPPRDAPGSAEAAVEQLKATVGNLILAPGLGVSLGGRGDPRIPRGHLTPVPFSCRAPSGGRRPVSGTAGTRRPGGVALGLRATAWGHHTLPWGHPILPGCLSWGHPILPEPLPWGHPILPGPLPWGHHTLPGPLPWGHHTLPGPCSLGTSHPSWAPSLGTSHPSWALFLRDITPFLNPFLGDIPSFLGAFLGDIPSLLTHFLGDTPRPPGAAAPRTRRPPAWASAASSPWPRRRSVRAGGIRGGVGWGSQPCADPSAPSPGLSRGPSPVVLGSQDALPVATAFTEYVHAYFKGRDADSCLVKVTGELTMSFPAGIVRVFGGPAAPPVLSFRLLNAGAIEQFLPNAELLY